MGYQTPNIDRIAKEGVFFTNYFGQQSCTAGRAAFINGSVPVRTGMTKDFITRQTKAGKPFFCWWHGTRMHFRTHVKEERRHKGNDEYTDGRYSDVARG